MKRLLSIFIMVLSLSLGFILTACNFNFQNQTNPLAAVTFLDQKYEYDGIAKSIKVENLPAGYTVEYEGNDQTDPNTYRVIATIKDSSGKVAKTMVAKLIIVHTHDHKLKTDASSHWTECFCGDKTEKEAHKGGTATETEKAKCSVCGNEYGDYKQPEHTHNYEQKSDANNHWKECSCGDKTVAKAHTGGEATETEKAKCSVCQAEYGDYAQGIDPVIAEYSIEINGVDHVLEVNTRATLLQNQLGEYMALGLTVNAGDTVVVKCNGEIITNIGPDSGENNVSQEMTIITAGTVDVYFKVWQDGGHSIWVTGKATSTPGGDQGGDTPSGDQTIPTTGYHLVINGTTYIALTSNGAALDPSFTEYYALAVTFNVGDVVTLYDADAKASWAIQTPDSYSDGSWTGGAKGITCNEAGSFDVYVKMKFQADQIYFGLAN
jgi:hypothetical protein